MAKNEKKIDGFLISVCPTHGTTVIPVTFEEPSTEPEGEVVYSSADAKTSVGYSPRYASNWGNIAWDSERLKN